MLKITTTYLPLWFLLLLDALILSCLFCTRIASSVENCTHLWFIEYVFTAVRRTSQSHIGLDRIREKKGHNQSSNRNQESCGNFSDLHIRLWRFRFMTFDMRVFVDYCFAFFECAVACIWKNLWIPRLFVLFLYIFFSEKATFFRLIRSESLKSDQILSYIRTLYSCMLAHFYTVWLVWRLFPYYIRFFVSRHTNFEWHLIFIPFCGHVFTDWWPSYVHKLQ